MHFCDAINKRIYFKAYGLNENMLDFLDSYSEAIELFGLQYKALLVSSRSEMHLMTTNYNTRVVSRIGFVSQEITDLEFETLVVIENRAIEINSYDAECILQALSDVFSSRDEAADVIANVGMKVMDDVATWNQNLAHPVFHQIEYLISQFEIEMFSIFRYFNSVTNMFQLLIELESEVRAYGALFEYFVNYIYVDMIILEILNDETSKIVFPQLNDGLEAFRASMLNIRSQMPNCNNVIEEVL